MKKRTKRLKATAIISIFLFLFAGILIIGDTLMLLSFHSAIINSVPDMTEWNLKNANYEVIADIDEKTKSISFHVCNNDNAEVFKSDCSWRLWDFGSIELKENNDITVISNDTGTFEFNFKDGTWICDGM